MSSAVRSNLSAFPTSYCAPSSPHQDNICLSDQDLSKAANMLHVKVPSSQPTRSMLWSAIQRQALSDPTKAPCSDSGACLLHHRDIVSDKKNASTISQWKNAFRPTMPSDWVGTGLEKWLRTEDIEDQLKQYEKADPTFMFIGVVPLDFDLKQNSECVYNVCKLDLEYLKKHRPSISKIGAVMNLDPHDKPGSHWVSFFIDTKRKFLAYFDSYGDAMPKEVKRLFERLQTQHSALYGGSRFAVHVNTKAFQKRDNQCGVFAMHAVIRLITEPPEKVFSTPETEWTDNAMRDLRRVYYSPPLSVSKSINHSVFKSKHGGARKRYVPRTALKTWKTIRKVTSKKTKLAKAKRSKRRKITQNQKNQRGRWRSVPKTFRRP